MLKPELQLLFLKNIKKKTALTTFTKIASRQTFTLIHIIFANLQTLFSIISKISSLLSLMILLLILLFLE